jgi:hypothetical protein
MRVHGVLYILDNDPYTRVVHRYLSSIYKISMEYGVVAEVMWLFVNLFLIEIYD